MSVRLTDDQATVRHRLDLVWVALGLVLLVLSALPVDEHSLSGAERSVFRAVNEVPGIPFLPVWLLMQAGNVAAVVIATAGALVARRPRLAAALVAAGALAYGGAKLVKEFVTRGRPDTLLGDVEIHGTAAHGLGFVSGHAAVAVALAVVALPHLGPRARWMVAALAAFVCVARVYVGAHLPLDVVGGAALGLLVGALVRLAFGRPEPCS
ncbi:MAG TPA: phosphatase PAP2 family protein [Chloroflexota bacterium]|nr:phosphatase PAP2 family protein [Chloroflexota bacterium]